jgi:hypothetical protein
MTHQPSTFRVLHLLLEAFLENVGVVILPGVAGPEVENAVVGVAEPGVVAVSVVGVAAVSGVAEPAVDVVAVVVV